MTALEGTALYRFWGEGDLLLYIGISNGFGVRWKQHAKEKPWWDEVCRLSVDQWFDLRTDAEEAETIAITTEGPKYNQRITTARYPSAAKNREPHGCWDENGRRPWVPGYVGWPEAHDACEPGDCLGRRDASTGPEAEAIIRRALDGLRE